MQKQDLLRHFGTATAAAKALGISKSTVSLWKETVPWKYALLAERLTQGAIAYQESNYPNISSKKSD